MKNKQSITIKNVLTLLSKTKMPIHLYIIGLVVPIIVQYINVDASAMNARIMGGEVLNSSLIKSYIVYSIIGTILAFPKNISLPIVSKIYASIMQNKILDKMLNLRIAYYDRENANSLIGRFTNDIPSLLDSIEQVVTSIPSLLTVYLPFMKIYNQNKIFAIIVVVYSLVQVITSYIVSKWIKDAQIKALTAYSNVVSFFSERVDLINFIKTSGTENEDYDISKKYLQNQYETKVNLQIQTIKISVVNSSLSGLKTIGLYVVGSILIKQNIMDYPTLFLLANMIGLVDNSMIQLTSLTSITQRIKGSSNKLYELLELEEEEVKRKSEMPNDIKDIVFDNVSFGYSEKEILKNVNVTIPKGKMTAIVGPSGSGKTTILKMVDRFYEPNKGIIKLGNTNVEDINLDEWRKSIGYIVQSSPLVDGTIRDNITFGLDREASDEEIIKATKIAKIYDCIMALPNKFESDAKQLSTGQTQRVNIARAIILNPNYLVLDEATSNIDVENEYDIMNSLGDFMEDKTTIVVAHKLSTIIRADQIIVVDKGQIVGSGTHKELKENSELYKKFCDIQAV